MASKEEIRKQEKAAQDARMEHRRQLLARREELAEKARAIRSGQMQREQRERDEAAVREQAKPDEQP